MFLRKLHPELLDSLPPDHPDAQRSRRDLRGINCFMGNHRWFERVLPPLLEPGEHVLEIGAGTGELAARLATRGVTVEGLDLMPQPADWPATHRWHQADLTHFTGYRDHPVIIGNLIFHHFSAVALEALGALWRRQARLIVACEPARSRVSHGVFRAFGPLTGINHVTLHDAPVSIAAGFRGDELPRLLGLSSPEWECTFSTTLRGAYHLIARRRP